MKSTIKYYQEQKELHVVVADTFPSLIQLKKEGDLTSFNNQLLKILPEVKKYINGRLNTAIKKGHFSKNKYKADDIIDQLFIEVFDHIEDVKNKKDFYLWLFKKTNDLLEDIIVEEEFDELFFKNIDEYTKPEWDEMEENFSTDGDGDLLMIEELDDISYNHNDYTLNHVFIEDDEKGLVEKLDKELSEERIRNQIEMVLHNLPLAMRTVFDLSTKQQFTLKEIAKIKNTTIKEVQQLLDNARRSLKISFTNRYLNTNKG